MVSCPNCLGGADGVAGGRRHDDVELGGYGVLPEHVFESGTQGEVALMVVHGEVP